MKETDKENARVYIKALYKLVGKLDKPITIVLWPCRHAGVVWENGDVETIEVNDS